MVCIFSLWVTIWATAHVSHIRHFHRLGYVSCTESCSVAHGWGKKKKANTYFDLIQVGTSGSVSTPYWRSRCLRLLTEKSQKVTLNHLEVKFFITRQFTWKKKIPVQSTVCVCVTWFTGCTSCTGPGPGQQGSPLRPFTVFLHINVPLWDPRATVLICKHFFGTNAANSSRLKLC